MISIFKKLRHRKIKKLKAQAKVYEKKNNWAEACTIWSAISKSDAAYQFAYIKLGNIQNELGERHQAISSFQKIPDTNEQHRYDKYVGIAGVYERMENWQESLEAWEKSIAAVPPTSENAAKIAIALSHKAKCMLRLGQHGQSNIFVSAALYLDPTLRGDTDTTLTRMTLAQGDPQKVRNIAQRATRLGNKNESIKNLMMRLT